MGKVNYRHGDVLIISIKEAIKLGLTSNFKLDKKKKKKDFILAYGETTGHMHQLDVETDDNFDLYDIGDDMLLEVHEGIVPLVHEEHSKIDLPKGDWFITIQREYVPSDKKKNEWRGVVD